MIQLKRFFGSALSIVLIISLSCDFQNNGLAVFEKVSPGRPASFSQTHLISTRISTSISTEISTMVVE